MTTFCSTWSNYSFRNRYHTITLCEASRHLYRRRCLFQHINKLVSSAFFYLQQIKSIRRCLPADAAKSLVHAFMVSRLDYCKSLYASLPRMQLDRIQSVFNEAVQLFFGASRFSYVIPLLHDYLHWLCSQERISYKLCITVFNPLTAAIRKSGYNFFWAKWHQNPVPC